MDRKFKGGLLIVCAVLPLLIAASGGFPSRPRFQSVGVNAAAPATAGNLTASGTVTAATVNATSALQFNGSQVPTICGFDAVVSASPSVTNAWNCSPSISRNSAGNFTVTHNFASANQYITLCTQRGSTSGTPGLVSIQSQSSNSMILRTYDHTGTLSDSLIAIQCVVLRFLFA